jgi:hypothetical protein
MEARSTRKQTQTWVANVGPGLKIPRYPNEKRKARRNGSSKWTKTISSPQHWQTYFGPFRTRSWKCLLLHFCTFDWDFMHLVLYSLPFTVGQLISDYSRLHMIHWKKRKQNFPHIIRKFRRDRLKVIYDKRPPHIWLNICAFPHILGRPSSYMTSHPIHSEFPYLSGNFFFFISVKFC